MPYISRARAHELVGSGVSKTQLNKVTKALTAAARAVKDTNRNGEVDRFELGKAAKDVGLSKEETKAVFSAYGAVFMFSDPDGRNNRVSSASAIAEEAAGVAAELKDLMKQAGSSKVTSEVISGRRLSNDTVAVLEAAARVK